MQNHKVVFDCKLNTVVTQTHNEIDAFFEYFQQNTSLKSYVGN